MRLLLDKFALGRSSLVVVQLVLEDKSISGILMVEAAHCIIHYSGSQDSFVTRQRQFSGTHGFIVCCYFYGKTV